MKTLSIALLLALTAVVGCKKEEILTGSSNCLENEIAKADRMALCDDPSIEEYLFQGKTVYVSHPGTCGADMASPVFDAHCKSLGSLGGFMGNTRINGEDFSSATFVRTVWKK